MHINPLFWWGSFAVSAPIIIHLINRLRFKKLRWAAMEFLLKAQQRNRRRLIIEQLILLALRCLIIMLLVTMLTRPLWLMGGDQSKVAEQRRTAFHVVVVDDTLSMRDRERPGEERSTAFRAALNKVEKLAEDAQADKDRSHYFTVLTVSNPSKPVFGKPLKTLEDEKLQPGNQMQAASIGELKNVFAELKCSYTRPDMKTALEEARKYFEKVKEGNSKYFHLVSDFRAPDWTETHGNAMADELMNNMTKDSGIQVRLHDVAHPSRLGGNNQPALTKDQIPASHANIGITRLVAKSKKLADNDESPEALRPERFFTPTLPVYLYATVRNYTDAEIVGVRLLLMVDGKEVAEASVPGLKIPVDPKGVRVGMEFRFNKEMTTGFKRVSVHIDKAGEKDDHLVEDNNWFTYLELRNEVPILVVDPDHAAKDIQPDSFLLDAALTGAEKSGKKCFFVKPSELKTMRLNQYPVIYVLNVAGYSTEGSPDKHFDEGSLKALEQYVYNGGSVVFYLGDNVDYENYNKFLFRDAKSRGELGNAFKDPKWFATHPGVFPVRLDGPVKIDFPDDDDKHPKVRLLKDKHPAWGLEPELADWFVKQMFVAAYYPVIANKPENLFKNATVVMQMANRLPLADETIIAPVQDIAQDIDDREKKVFDRDQSARLRHWNSQIGTYLLSPKDKKARKGPLVDYFRGLIDDPILAKYWTDNKDFKLKVEAVRDLLQNGMPLIVEAEYGEDLLVAPVEPEEKPKPDDPPKDPKDPVKKEPAEKPKAGPDKPHGNVTAVLTQLSPKALRKEPGRPDLDWNNWAGSTFPAYVVHMLQLQNHMAAVSRTGTEVEIHRMIGGNLEVKLPVDKYSPKVRIYYVPYEFEGTLAPEDQDAPKVIYRKTAAGGGAVEGPEFVEEQTGMEQDGFHTFVLNPARGPGYYVLRVNNPKVPQKDRDGKNMEEPGDVDTETDKVRLPGVLPLAFNVDGGVEGNLRRVSEQSILDLLKTAAKQGGVKTDDEALTMVESKDWFAKGGPQGDVSKQQSWADYSFMLVLFLFLLCLESLLAMLFSHHLKEGEANLPPQALRGMRVMATRPGAPAQAEAMMQ